MENLLFLHTVKRIVYTSMYPIEELSKEHFPALLSEINDPPEKLYLRGVLPRDKNKILCVVGSRHHTHYGKDACEKLVSGLRGYPITIVSGLALGIDGIAHEAALAAHLQTIAVPGSGLNEEVLYPARHKKLAHRIIEAGGGLLSQFEPDHRARPENFPERNRIMAGLSHAILIIEAQVRSGTLITARLATDYNREVLAVPGSIFSQRSEGPHMLIKLGAEPVTSSNDILSALGFDYEKEIPIEQKYKNCSEKEQALISFLKSPMSKRELQTHSLLTMSELNVLLSILEIKGVVKESGGLWHLRS